MPLSQKASLALPPQLGRYVVLERLASGGMASVYVGRQVGAAGFERIVAIKCCHDHLSANASFASMFLEEARLAARIRHPNVVATLDVSDGDPLYLIMEYVEGESLSALARRAGRHGRRLPIDVSLRIMMDALSGLQAAHECLGPDGSPLGLVHCDVSPQNILVGIDGAARITDFGIARAAAELPEDRTVIKGKLAYLAPEQLSAAPITQRSDVFSAGVVLWELLTGQALFCGDSDVATVRAALLRPIPAPSTIEATVPRSLDGVVLRALERDPDLRFSSALEFLTALEELRLEIATGRAVGEYVRREIGPGALASRWESGAFRKGTVVDATTLPESPEGAPTDAPTRVVTEEQEMPTREVEPSPDLVAATGSRSVPPDVLDRAQRPISMTDANQLRRLVVAVALILLGCGAGLLLTSRSASRAADPEGAAPALQSPASQPPRQ